LSPLRPRTELAVPVAVAAAIVIGGIALTARRAPVPAPPPAAPAPARPPDRFAHDIRPLLDAFCFTCHSGAKAKAGVDLAAIADEADALKARRTWKKVWAVMHDRAMPPPGRPAPAAGQRERLTLWLEETLGRIDGTGGRDPGRVVLRRLNRAEYRNTIRDLTGVDYAPAADFPGDEVGYGFDTTGDTLALPPLLLERYFEAAGRILDRAIVTAEQRAPVTRAFGPADLEGNGARGRGDYVLFTTGEATGAARVALEADYVVRVKVGGDQAGGEPIRMTIRADGEDLAAFDVREKRANARVYEARARLRPGAHRVGAAFHNDYYNPRDPDPENRDRNLVIYSVELVGPVDLKPPESHRRIFTALPAGATGRRDAARQVLERFMLRAFRRPPAPDEVERHVRLFETAQGSFEAAMKVPLRAVLVSPHFLFRVEADAEPGVRPVADFELATRVSYFLWSSAPDDELLDLAAQGRLAASLEAQVRRMLRDPRASALAENFASQWLQVRRLPQAAPDPALFPQFDEALRDAMEREAVLFFESVLREERSALDLLESNYTFLNERLAKHYGIEGVVGPQMRRVRLEDPRRGGVLTLAGVLTVTSHPTRTSPSKRGKWVMETLLGTPPPPPLPDAPTLREDPKEAGEVSLRARLEQHRANPRCSACHAAFDPLGFGLENFDPLGAWRERDDAGPIDASASLPDGSAFHGAADLKKLLLSRRDDFLRCLVEKLMTYALGRGLEYFDAAEVRRIARSADTLSGLVLEIARSYPFLHRRAKAGETHDD
jgi:hypothetical protein